MSLYYPAKLGCGAELSLTFIVGKTKQKNSEIIEVSLVQVGISSGPTHSHLINHIQHSLQ